MVAMALSSRQIGIIERLLKSEGALDVKSLASSTGVSVQTIYNDLRAIESVRFSLKNGRIELNVHQDDKDLVSKKINQNRVGREKACTFAVKKLLRGKTKAIIFIDGGSTGYIFYKCLESLWGHELTIITNNPLILGDLSSNGGFLHNNSVYSIGGKLDPMRLSLYSIKGGANLAPFESDQYSIDYLILGFRALSSTGQILIDNEEEIEQKRRLISKSKNILLIADPEKIDAAGLFGISSIPDENKDKNFYLIMTNEKKQYLKLI
jgi:DeoR/GlpR family transcriptional regulator of sugar metabolism